MKEELIRNIITLEWPMFASVENQGGKASCQSRPQTFDIMRRSQFLTWDEETLAAYLKDLEDAGSKGRNLCTEKYAFMMENTAPEDFKKLLPYLPVVDAETMDMIEEIVALHLAWEAEMDEKYPAIRSRGRALRSAQDTPYSVSVETYMRSELKSYSKDTVRALYAHTLSCSEKGINMARQTLENTMKAYGYQSLEEAEEKCRIK